MKVAGPRIILGYVLFRCAHALVLSFGLDFASRLARGAADLFYRYVPKHRKRALANLYHAMPELPVGERERIERDSFRSLFVTMVETVYFPRVVHRGCVGRQIRLSIHPEARKVMDSGSGVIFASGHIGNWELTGTSVGFLGLGQGMVSVARPLNNPLVDRFAVRGRERMGQKIVPKKGALRELSRALKDGRFLGVLVDQNVRKHGVFVEFFGLPASTTGAPAALAIRYRAPIVPARQRRVGPGFVHELHVEAPLPFPGTGSREQDVWSLTQALTARIEEWVRAEPGQWLWAHRRWKTQPKEGEGWKPNPSTSTG